MSASSGLGEHEVHVWRIDLTVATARSARAVARDALREILGGYLAVPPSDVAFASGPAGKPILAAPHDRSRLTFNLSHSGQLALGAVARRGAVGIDLERVRPAGAVTDVMRYFFTAAERRAFRAVPWPEREVTFLRAWTQKEAYVKAIGGRLLELLGQFSVSMDPAAPPRLVSHRRPGEVQRWTLTDVRAGRGYVATLAVDGRPRALRYWHWPAGGELARMGGLTTRGFPCGIDALRGAP